MDFPEFSVSGLKFFLIFIFFKLLLIIFFRERIKRRDGPEGGHTRSFASSSRGDEVWWNPVCSEKTIFYNPDLSCGSAKPNVWCGMSQLQRASRVYVSAHVLGELDIFLVIQWNVKVLLIS